MKNVYFMKPVVKYQPTDADYIVVGHKAIITPVGSEKETLTKQVQHLLQIGFETEDTVYQPYAN